MWYSIIYTQVHLYRKFPTLCRLFEVLLIKNWLKWHKYRHKLFAFTKKPNIWYFFYFYGVNSDQDWCIYKKSSLGFADFLKFGAYIGLWCEKLQWRMILQCPCQHGSSWPVINWLKKKSRNKRFIVHYRKLISWKCRQDLVHYSTH